MQVETAPASRMEVPERASFERGGRRHSAPGLVHQRELVGDLWRADGPQRQSPGGSKPRQRQAETGKPGLLADAEPEDGDGARPRAADRFQVYPREARGRETDAVAEQHRKYMHQDLVDETPPQALASPWGAFIRRAVAYSTPRVRVTHD